MRALKGALKRLVGDRGVHLARRLDRFRLLLKARRIREEGASFRDDPLNIAKFVLVDPETHSYSYDLGNPDELVGFAAEHLGADPKDLRAWLAELEADPELHRELRRRTRWRIDAKTRMPLGNRVLWYLVVRHTRPRLIVETGIWDGLGSLMLLRALDRNAAEGAEGALLSIDNDPESGWLVPDRLTGRWEKMIGDILADLEGAIGGRYALFVERPARHFYRPPGTALAIFGDPAS